MTLTIATVNPNTHFGAGAYKANIAQADQYVRTAARGARLVCLLEEHGEGVHIAEVDLDRVRWLRQEPDRNVRGASPWRTKPGVLRDWRRADLLINEGSRACPM
jgi:predicted amidohydrolase